MARARGSNHHRGVAYQPVGGASRIKRYGLIFVILCAIGYMINLIIESGDDQTSELASNPNIRGGPSSNEESRSHLSNEPTEGESAYEVQDRKPSASNKEDDEVEAPNDADDDAEGYDDEQGDEEGDEDLEATIDIVKDDITVVMEDEEIASAEETLNAEIDSERNNITKKLTFLLNNDPNISIEQRSPEAVAEITDEVLSKLKEKVDAEIEEDGETILEQMEEAIDEIVDEDEDREESASKIEEDLVKEETMLLHQASDAMAGLVKVAEEKLPTSENAVIKEVVRTKVGIDVDVEGFKTTEKEVRDETGGEGTDKGSKNKHSVGHSDVKGQETNDIPASSKKDAVGKTTTKKVKSEGEGDLDSSVSNLKKVMESREKEEVKQLEEELDFELDSKKAAIISRLKKTLKGKSEFEIEAIAEKIMSDLTKEVNEELEKKGGAIVDEKEDEIDSIVGQNQDEGVDEDETLAEVGEIEGETEEEVDAEVNVVKEDIEKTLDIRVDSAVAEVLEEKLDVAASEESFRDEAGDDNVDAREAEEDEAEEDET